MVRCIPPPGTTTAIQDSPPLSYRSDIFQVSVLGCPTCSTFVPLKPENLGVESGVLKCI